MLSRRGSGSRIIGLLDLGSSKICCAIVERTEPAGPDGAAQLRLLGLGQQRSDGIRNGMVVDLDRAEPCVSRAIGAAEEQAGVTLDSVTVAVTNLRLASAHFSAHLDLIDGTVGGEDLKRIGARAREYAERNGSSLIFLDRIHYTLDGAVGIRSPLNMIGQRLSCQYHAVTADPAHLRNLEALIERCYLSVDGFVPAGYASAIAATTSDERQYGVIAVDIGAGATKIAVIADDRFLYTDTLALGGAYLTHDVAAKLSTTLSEAERIKTLYGTLVNARSDQYSAVAYWRAEENGLVGYRAAQGEQQETTRAELSRILYPRARHQLELIRERIERNPVMRDLAQSIVLTGGACQLAGFPALAGDILGRRVRIGSPEVATSSSSPFASPAMSTIVGLGLSDVQAADQANLHGVQGRVSNTYLSRMEQWLRESF